MSAAAALGSDLAAGVLAARYALLVSVRAPGGNIDVYTPTANQLAILVPPALDDLSFASS
jgi:hypothetical protein